MTVQLVNDDCCSYLRKMEGKVKCIFFDPPEFLEDYVDERTHDKAVYNLAWMYETARLAVERCDIFWVTIPTAYWVQAIGDLKHYHNCITKMRRFEWHRGVSATSEDSDYDAFKTIIQIRKSKLKVNFCAISDIPATKLSGCKVATKNKVAQNIWHIAKLCPISKEYVDWCDGQIPVIIYHDIIRYSCLPGDTFLDLTAGTGTCFRAARLNSKVNIIGVEANLDYCQKIKETHIEFHKQLIKPVLV